MYRGKTPIPGEFNICAIDGTVHFKDSEGREMGADDDGNLEKVLLLTDMKTGGYGMMTQLSAINEYSSLRAEGRFYRLSSVREYPAKVTEKASLYKNVENGKLNLEKIDEVIRLCEELSRLPVHISAAIRHAS